MKRVAIAAFASVLMVGSAAAQYDEDAACVMYEHNNYRGRALPMQSGQAVSFRNGQFWNDRVTSIRVARGCTLMAYQHSRMRGNEREFNRDDHNIGNWSDGISSAECYCDSW
ncbi:MULTISPECIES: beta/gamma crystallin domain-containing protein [unclassified Mesorhizobium]|jgi:hypothetical protein|uniref:beta/gamma crystallin domain-containing protein n=1 Tax=unclassified Mesorhizobium TaxID=325217 RepID=UPI0008E86DFB|nr:MULTISPECIES: beta/gamma crystallin domain-containing protein [unclassified Mesorhizobium]RJG44756.1 hypothetical protein D3Y55_11090 [Mesorhizobium sp. DCY119]SFU04646.1 Beta/Gamma crystallin [Mesorhizobium sp. YR577]